MSRYSNGTLHVSFSMHRLICCMNFEQTRKACQVPSLSALFIPTFPPWMTRIRTPARPSLGTLGSLLQHSGLPSPLGPTTPHSTLPGPRHGSAPLKTTQQARLTSPGPTRLGCSGPLPRSLPSFMSVCPLNPRARSLPSLPR